MIVVQEHVFKDIQSDRYIISEAYLIFLKQ